VGVATDVVAYRFGGFILDLQRAALVTEKGESVPVRHQSFRLLCLFVENAGRLVERKAITQALWPRLTVSDDSITQCVGDLRRALRDESQTKIKTVLRRGYIFTPEVTSASSIPSTDQLALVGRPSVAVLPFSNMSADPSQDYLADGVAENVTTELARNRSLLVIARTSSFTYKDRSVGVQQVALELGVEYVVEGSVQRSSDRIRITAQLIDARNSSHLWAERFDLDLTDLFVIQDEIAHAIVSAIDPAISHSERRRALQKPPATLTAWEAWQRALWHWSKGSNLATRLAFLQRTLQLDPEFASAHAMLVRLYLSEATQGVGRTLEEGVRLAEAEAQIALDLDPQNSMAHASLAWVLDHQGNAAAALTEAEIALRVNPNDSEGHLIKGHVLAMSGRFAEAQQSLSIALRLDPRGPTAPAAKHNQTVACYLARDYQVAESITRQSIREYPDLPRAYVWRAAVLGQLGHHDALAALEKAASVAPGYLRYKTDERSPYMRPEDHDHFLEGLRKAGWRG
jgi:adenylate cyclase